ncbi:DUF3889 domain-containing protein [Bacillus weihaiensis]|uniref:DUF3889 domain-containing protein n=1 Tax=Bacillus weihaiensis TaxID=1547283 RepID=UPI0023558ACF|nr:DUF3889 domain-containing protein [Bacillus weihaiensis]
MNLIPRTKILFTVVAFLLMLTAGMKAYGEHNDQELDYEKWSKIAISSVQEKYPSAEVTDYKYVKREEVNEAESKDVFHLKVKEQEKIMIVNVEVVFNPINGKLITVKVEELEQQDF